MKSLLSIVLLAALAPAQTATPKSDKPKEEAKSGCCGSGSSCCGGDNAKKDEAKKGGCCGSEEGSMCKREPMKDKKSTEPAPKK
jgi:hypothetical protein